MRTCETNLHILYKLGKLNSFFLKFEVWLLKFELNLNCIHAAAANKLCLINTVPWPFDRFYRSSEPAILVGQLCIYSCAPLHPSGNIFLAPARGLLAEVQICSGLNVEDVPTTHCLKVHCWTSDLKSKQHVHCINLLLRNLTQLPHWNRGGTVTLRLPRHY